MTDTTDINALREKLWDLDEAHDLRQLGDDIIDRLEAEHQRADDCNKSAEYSAATNKRVVAANCRLQEELAALKGDQVPVAWLITPGEGGIACVETNQELIERLGEIAFFNVEPLFTAPQKPVVPDSKTWDELCLQNPEMTMGDAIIRAAAWNACRDAMLSGAIEAAGGIVKDGE